MLMHCSRLHLVRLRAVNSSPKRLPLRGSGGHWAISPLPCVENFLSCHSFHSRFRAKKWRAPLRNSPEIRPVNQSPESVVRRIKRKTRKRYSPEEKIRVVLEGLRGEESIAEICRRDIRSHLIHSPHCLKQGVHSTSLAMSNCPSFCFIFRTVA
jgi:transposase